MKLLPPRLAHTLLATALLLGLSACGNNDKKTATQVAARVGSEEISIHQINQVLSRSNTAGATAQAVQAMSREVLEKLIDQQLAVEQATDNKLHRSPDVVSQIEAARRDILARAYMTQVTSALPKPTTEEVKKYYLEKPQLFSERRIYNVQEIVLPATPGVADSLRSLAASAKSMEDIANWLKGQNIQFNGGSATRAAEQIPLEMLPQIHALKDGQTTVLSTPQGITVLRLVASQSAPVAQADALPRIEQFLTNQRASEAVTANLKLLRANAKISYLGEFAQPAGSAVELVATTPAPAVTASDGKTKTAIEKGVAGLK
jgi:EpsD family peptidyl-prolyl cis-trans isomerase